MDTANNQAPPQAPLVQITNQQLTDQDLEIYIQEGLFHPGITEVELPSNQITAVGLRTLLDSPIEFLQVLSLYDNQIGDVGAQVIANSEKLAGVMRLDVAYNAISIEGITALFGQGSSLTGPVWINLAGNRFGDEGLTIILNSNSISTLNGLVLRRTGLTDSSAIALSQTSSWQNLQYLDLSGNLFTESGRNMIMQNPSLHGVEVVFE
ncbi:MAG: hypothetical protein VKJ64_16830 [Leptolyngbyaceae bacterium]|nr:hypothetical protein [Leptolyngbyaceae bacterium]